MRIATARRNSGSVSWVNFANAGITLMGPSSMKKTVKMKESELIVVHLGRSSVPRVAMVYWTGESDAIAGMLEGGLSCLDDSQVCHKRVSRARFQRISTVRGSTRVRLPDGPSYSGRMHS